MNSTGYGRGRVPTEPVLQVIDEWLESRGHVEGETRIPLFHLLWPGRNYANCATTIYRLRRQKWMEFDLADKIVTRLAGPFAWYDDERLSIHYQSVVLA